MSWISRDFFSAIFSAVASPFQGRLATLVILIAHWRRDALQAEPFFCLSILAFSKKTLQESSKIFIEYALHVARIQARTQA